MYDVLSLNDLTWREIVEKHHSSMVDELSRRLDSDLEDAVSRALASERFEASGQLARACDQARVSQAEVLNQSLRRLRQATGEEHILQTLSESCASWAESSVVLVFENNQARAATCRGIDAGELFFDIASAPAVMAAIETRDPVVALANEAELSADLARIFRSPPGDQSEPHAYLFPLTSRHSVVAMLIASGGFPLNSAPIELLCEAAGMRLESLPSPELSMASELVPLVTGRSISAASERLTWESLSPEDQKLHLRAQRVARVRVAEMRLSGEANMKEGLASGDIYGALQSAIDNARNQFRREFLEKSPTMVDYLHLEMVRSLAHDEDRLLGHNYPGPMV